MGYLVLRFLCVLMLWEKTVHMLCLYVVYSVCQKSKHKNPRVFHCRGQVHKQLNCFTKFCSRLTGSPCHWSVLLLLLPKAACLCVAWMQLLPALTALGHMAGDSFRTQCRCTDLKFPVTYNHWNEGTWFPLFNVGFQCQFLSAGVCHGLVPGMWGGKRGGKVRGSTWWFWSFLLFTSSVT